MNLNVDDDVLKNMFVDEGNTMWK